MSDSPFYAPPPSLGKPQRIALGIVGVLLVTVWSIAAWLSPNPQGFGTHQQLGLPPCSIIEWLGKPCPACGMTTSWSLLIRGRIGSALYVNVGGTLLGLVALAATPWTLASAWRGKWWGYIPDEWIIALVLSAIMAITLIDWWARRL